MEEMMQSTDALVDDYTTRRHIFALTADDGGDAPTTALNEAKEIESELESRGVAKDKLRAFWSNYAEAHGLDH